MQDANVMPVVHPPTQDAVMTVHGPPMQDANKHHMMDTPGPGPCDAVCGPACTSPDDADKKECKKCAECHQADMMYDTRGPGPMPPMEAPMASPMMDHHSPNLEMQPPADMMEPLPMTAGSPITAEPQSAE